MTVEELLRNSMPQMSFPQHQTLGMPLPPNPQAPEYYKPPVEQFTYQPPMPYQYSQPAQNFAPQTQLIQAPNLPPHIKATYTGTYYHAANSKELEPKPFKYDLLIPLPLVLDPNQTPVSIFVIHMTKRVLKPTTGSAKTQNVYLTHAEGVPYNQMSGDQLLNWLTDYNSLAHIAANTAIEYQPYDMAITEAGYIPGPKAVAQVRLELWPDVDELRYAIKMLRKDPEGFMLQQKRRADKGNVVYMQGVDQMFKQLGY